ncbi:MAG TPA: ribosome biogenesis factor YjgA [Burkholderiales bacterium]|jgi:ribosome-associated protein|nr:ribosome biogenesis factor YjgA [Burkholderiales bacterium]
MRDETVSKTQKKREMEELQKLGASLVALPPTQLDALDLPAELLAAVREAQRIKSHEGRRRQLQFIGKVMRSIDPAPVRAALAARDGQSAAARVEQRTLERWRERLIGDDAALTEFSAQFPQAEIEQVRALIRNARHELAEGRPPRAQRELFRVLRGYLNA